MHHFWRRGYRSTTTRELETSLGINQSSLYNAFGSKSQLADAAIERYLTRMRERLFAPLASAPDGLAAIDDFLTRVERWQLVDEGRGCLMGRLMGEGDVGEPAVAARLAEYRESLAGALRSALDAAARRGDISAESAAQRSEMLVGAVFGLSMACQAGFGADAVHAIAEATREEVAGWRGAPAAAV